MPMSGEVSLVEARKRTYRFQSPKQPEVQFRAMLIACDHDELHLEI